MKRVRIKVKYAGRCATCGLPLELGEYSMFEPATGKIIHAGCDLTKPRRQIDLPEPTIPEKRLLGMGLSKLTDEKLP